MLSISLPLLLLYYFFTKISLLLFFFSEILSFLSLSLPLSYSLSLCYDQCLLCNNPADLQHRRLPFFLLYFLYKRLLHHHYKRGHSPPFSVFIKRGSHSTGKLGGGGPRPHLVLKFIFIYLFFKILLYIYIYILSWSLYFQHKRAHRLVVRDSTVPTWITGLSPNECYFFFLFSFWGFVCFLFCFLKTTK